MGLPPKDVPASALLKKLCETPRPSEVVDFPRKDAQGEVVGKLRIQVLPMHLHDEGRLRAHHWLIEKKGLKREDLSTLLVSEVAGDRTAREILAMACLTEDCIEGTDEPGRLKRYGKIFQNADELNELTGDELAVLFATYEMIQHKYGPHSGNIDSDDELNAWISRLKEGAASFPLSRLSLHQLAELTMSLSERLCSLSAVAEYLLPALPRSLDAPFRMWDIGTGSFGAPPVGFILPGLESSSKPPDEPAQDGPEIPKLPDEPITTERAAELAKLLFDKG